jgi:DNA-binding PadR family transcriptional regulator
MSTAPDLSALTTTSYAFLGLLAERPWTTYELAQQVHTSLRNFWPRSERQLYEQPKLLVAHGLASATREHVGRRPRTVYRITPAGRRALRAWLAVPSTTCGSFEWDAVVKVFLSDHGTKDHLLAQLHAMQDANRADDEWHRDVWAQRLRDRPFAQRMHINALVSRFFVELTAATDRWAEWALHEVGSWETVAEPPADLEELFEEIFAPMDDRAAQ